MIVALHFRSMYAEPGGVWWEQDGILKRHYTDPLLEVAGLSTMLPLVADADIDAWFTYLGQRTPYGDTWERAELEPGMSPQEFLTLMQRVVMRLLA